MSDSLHYLGRVFANGPGDRDSIPGRVIPKTQSQIACTIWVECSPMVLETGVQFQAESYQRLKKWYLMPPCLTLNIIRYGSKVKWSNPGNGIAPSFTPWCSSSWKGCLRSSSTNVVNFTYSGLFAGVTNRLSENHQFSMRINRIWH